MLLPREHEFLEFFEVEPTLTDPTIIWTYNEVAFVTRRGEEQIEFSMSPGFSEVLLRWSQGEVRRLFLHLFDVETISFSHSDRGRSVMTLVSVSFGPIVVYGWPEFAVQFTGNRRQ